MTIIPPTNPRLAGGIDRVLSVQRPAVLAHIRSIRRSKPDATPEQVIRLLEQRYLAAVTTGGALVGASTVIPGVGLVASIALSTVETAGFLEASALFAQSVTEIHGIVVDDPERARALVMTLMLGTAGTDLVRQLAGQIGGVGPTRTGFWGNLITKSLPQSAMGQITDQIRKTFIKHFAARQTGTVLGRAIPFGIGAVIGGTGNHILGRRVVAGSRDAFGVAPEAFPLWLEPTIRVPSAAVEGRQGLPRRLTATAVDRISRVTRRRGRAADDADEEQSTPPQSDPAAPSPH